MDVERAPEVNWSWMRAQRATQKKSSALTLEPGLGRRGHLSLGQGCQTKGLGAKSAPAKTQIWSNEQLWMC